MASNKRQKRLKARNKAAARQGGSSKSAKPTNKPSRSRDPVQALQQALIDCNPGYRGQGEVTFVGRSFVGVDLSGQPIRDLSPLADIDVPSIDLTQCPVADLSPLQGKRVRELYLEATQVTDIAVLDGMPLERLHISQTKVADLTPIGSSSLVELNAMDTNVADITPLRGLPITMLWLSRSPVRDLSPLGSVPLESLTVEGCPVDDLSPLTGHATLRRLHIALTEVTDLTPIVELELTRLIFSPPRITKGLEQVRAMSTLTEIGMGFEAMMSPPRFWSLIDSMPTQA